MKRIWGAIALAVAVYVAGCSSSANGGNNSPTLMSIAVTPSSASVATGATQQFKATGTYSDNSTADVTNQSTWASSSTATATISAAGLATGVAPGTSNITASRAGVTSAAATLTVTGKTVTSIAVTPNPASVIAGSTVQFTATATYNDNSTANVTSTATWGSASTSVATINASGLATGVVAGTSNITATLSGVTSPAVVLTVTPAPVLQSIAVTPANPTVASPNTQQFTATGTYSDTSTKDLTGQVTWASSNTAVATIAAGGLATTNGAGTSTITATLGSVSGNTTLTVTGTAIPVSLQVTPATDTVSVASTVVYSAVELLSDGTTQPPTGTVTWGSGTTATATIDANNGIALAVANGTTVITATEGTLTGTANLTVQAAVARFAFNADQGVVLPPPSGGVLSEWSVVPATPAFTPVTTTAAVAGLQHIIVHPTGHFFYAIDQNGDLVQYDVDSTSGTVTPDPNPPTPTVGGIGALSKAAIDPSGRFIYVVNAVTSSPAIYSFAIDLTTAGAIGKLTAIGSSPITANLSNPSDILIDKTGTHAYVVDGGNSAVDYKQEGPGSIFQFSIDQISGALTALTPASVATGQGPWYGTFNPAGTFFYVTNVADESISVFSVGAGGALTLATADVPVVGSLEHPIGVAVDPSGKYIYIGAIDGGLIYGYILKADGTVDPSQGTPNSPYTPGNGSPGPSPWGLTIDPSGTLLVVDNNAINTITPFKLNPATGELTSQSDVASGQAPYFITFYTAVSGQ